MTSAPIENGWLHFSEGQILQVGSGSPAGDCQDLGDIALLPRLINAHTHLEFSDHLSPVGFPGITFPEWIKKVIAARGSADPSQKADVIRSGQQEVWDSGALLAGEIATPPFSYQENHNLPKVATFAEVLGLAPDRFNERLQAAIDHLQDHTLSGFSPHAPYSISPQGLSSVIDHAERKKKPLMMHVAESPEERELLLTGGGKLAEMLESLGLTIRAHFPWSREPFLDLFESFAKLPNTFLVHGNDLTDTEILSLAKCPQITVVYCPRTHHFFRFAKHPVQKMLRAGIRVVLGTDSRASNPDLNLWREIQFLLSHRQEIDPETVLKMGSLFPAEAFRLAFPKLAAMGSLQPGHVAQMGWVATSAKDLDQLYRDLSVNDYQNLQLP